MNPYELVHKNAADKRAQHEWRSASNQWWLEPDLWYERHTHEDTARPTETLALEHIYLLARIYVGDYRTVLSELEAQIDDCMSAFKKRRSGYPELHYIQQTAIRMEMPIFQVRSILVDIEQVKRHYAALETVLNASPLPVAS
jgi:hypothetical protein